jgi:GAF domain-containing protein
MESVIVAPLMTQTRPLGALILAADDPDQPLTDVDVMLAMDFASHAALVYEFASGQTARVQLAALADRERLAAELSRRIVSKLFAIGLTLQGLMEEAVDSVAPVINACVDDLDSAIAEIRGAIFDASAADDRSQPAS